MTAADVLTETLIGLGGETGLAIPGFYSSCGTDQIGNLVGLVPISFPAQTPGYAGPGSCEEIEFLGKTSLCFEKSCN